MKYTDGKWYWSTIKEFYTLTLFDLLDKIHEYNKELERILANAEGHSTMEVDALRAVFVFENTEGNSGFQVKLRISQYNALKALQKPHWPEIILDTSKSGFAFFTDTANTLV